MKCYTLDYRLSQRAPKTIFVSRNSSFQIGIKAMDGDVQAEVLSLDINGSQTMPSASKLAGYTVFDLSSGDYPKSEEAKVAVSQGEGLSASTVLLPLQIVTTSSTVAEVSQPIPEHQSVTFSGEYEDGTQFSYELLEK